MMDQKIEDQQETETSSSTLPILPRLDRIDRLLQLAEERRYRCCCRRSVREASNCSKQVGEEDANNGNAVFNKSLSSAMEEVSNKGTLMERLEMLENRVFQLWVEIDHEGGVNASSIFTSSSPVLSENENESSAKTITSTSNNDSDDQELKKPNVKGRHYKNRQLLRKNRWFRFTMGC